MVVLDCVSPAFANAPAQQAKAGSRMYQRRLFAIAQYSSRLRDGFISSSSSIAVHSQAREIVAQGFTATLLAATLAISRSSLYYRKQPRKSRAERQYDEQ